MKKFQEKQHKTDDPGGIKSQFAVESAIAKLQETVSNDELSKKANLETSMNSNGGFRKNVENRVTVYELAEQVCCHPISSSSRKQGSFY